MALPRSFAAGGFVTPEAARRKGNKFKGVMIGNDGLWDTGKTEFALGAPGPGLGIMLDRGFDSVFDNPNPPSSRQDDWAFQVVKVPTATQSLDTAFYKTYWYDLLKIYIAAMENPDARSVLFDGDSDSWELQRLASFGKLQGVPPLSYTDVTAARRALYNRAWDSGKVCIFTNKCKAEYATELDEAGNPKVSANGNEIRKPTGEMTRQGFNDMDYLFQIQIRHMRDEVNGYGLRILKCKVNTELVGAELWGDDCNMPTLLQTCFPNVELSEWGY